MEIWLLSLTVTLRQAQNKRRKSSWCNYLQGKTKIGAQDWDLDAIFMYLSCSKMSLLHSNYLWGDLLVGYNLEQELLNNS